jgi:signal transduction histidine kinase
MAILQMRCPVKLEHLLTKAKTEQTDGRAPASTQQPSRQADLSAILNVVHKINTSLVLTDVLELVIDEAIRIANAERGFLMLADNSGKLQFAIGRDGHEVNISVDMFRVSSTVLDDVFSTGESICIESAMTHERFIQMESITNLELQTILCSALRTREEKIGVIYVDSKSIQPIDKGDTLRLFEILAGQAAIAIKNARLFQNLATAYEELQQTNKQMVQFERMAMKGEIAAEVSHELKNHVAVALSSIQGLQRGLGSLPETDVRTLLESAHYATKKIQKFSQSILTRSRAGSQRGPMSLSAVVYHFIDFIRSLPKFRRNVMQLKLADDAPEVSIDVDQIQQVLLNLVSNAAEASPAATIELATQHDASSGVVVLTVHDDGPGIPIAVQEKLFHEKITTKPDGHGFGLPICKQIIEEHGGTIELESIEQHGTTFIITLPVHRGLAGTGQKNPQDKG